MIKAFNCAALETALNKLKQIVKHNEGAGQKTVVFCEDRLSLVAERTVCAAVEGTFLTSVYTFARFLSAEAGKSDNVLSAQGSAMAVRRIIEAKKGELKLFKKLSAADSAQTVYDTIAILYASRISAQDVERAAQKGGVLGGKLHDLAIIYSGYEKYLEESGKQDRNGYLKRLAPVIEISDKIRGSTVVFLGFQAFTCTVTECACAAFSAAKNVCGLFIGGDEDIYVNEACAAFSAAAKEYGGAEICADAGERNEEAEALRRGLFNPESFYSQPSPSKRVHIYEARDGEEELEFIAASIKKHVLDGRERYAKISVMLPDMDVSERLLSRVFKRYRIPYYADRQIPLSEHSLCAFIINYLLCVVSGCRPCDVDMVVSSPYFPAEIKDKDVFRNYALKLANYRGGVKRQPESGALEALGFDFGAVERVRELFLKGFYLLSDSVKSGICEGIRRVLAEFCVKEKCENLAERFRAERPADAAFNARAYEGVISVLGEAETLTDGGVQLKEFIKILKSGFSAMKISLIPPKSDAVFVGDLAGTANSGSEVVFAARLTGEVPGASSDCALLTDREISALEDVNVLITPKIAQVNARRKEIIALNICAFRKHLYLTYPTEAGGEECGASEIIAYARAIFTAPSGENLKPTEIKKIEKSEIYAPYYCCEKLPALRRLQKFSRSPQTDAVYEALVRRGYANEADAALKKRVYGDISSGEKLYLGYGGSISPTALETYFACPYLGFMRQGLRVREREEGAVRAVDTGNFIHSVLQDMAPLIDGAEGEEQFKDTARSVAQEKLKKLPYSSLTDSESGAYAAGELVEEAVAVSAGMYAQIKNSSFAVAKTECSGEVVLEGGIKVYGRIDRVDESGDMVRVVDYKTGAIDSSASKYYSGAKLQLPLYLLAASGGKRATGAYYFPAAVEYGDKKDGVFRLRGFMDGSDDVVAASDSNVKPKAKSEYVEAYLGVKKIDSAMPREDFSAFLEYSRLVAGKGAGEMVAGNVAPSPSGEACKYCKAGGCCGFAVGRDGEERKFSSVKCSEIAALVKSVKGEGNE